MNSKGVIGKTFILFIATIVIVILLAIFIISSGAIKKIDNSNAGLKVYAPEEVGLNNLQDYTSDYIILLKVRYLINKGSSLEEAITEAGYEK